MNCLEMEIAIFREFNPRRNLIVPNVSWGLLLHEIDILVLRPSGVAIEIEIKVSKSDLIADKSKDHAHNSDKISMLYFAVPSNLLVYSEHIPSHAGIIEVREDGVCRYYRNAEEKSKYRFTQEERFQLARLGTMRISSLKNKIFQLKEQARGRL